jgi:hypothetical protein
VRIFFSGVEILVSLRLRGVRAVSGIGIRAHRVGNAMRCDIESSSLFSRLLYFSIFLLSVLLLYFVVGARGRVRPLLGGIVTWRSGLCGVVLVGGGNGLCAFEP